MPSNSDQHDEFMSLFLEHQPRIYGYVRSLLFQKADADDVMQETASVQWKKFDEYERETHFDRRAMRVAFHQVRYFRQKKMQDPGDEGIIRKPVHFFAIYKGNEKKNLHLCVFCDQFIFRDLCPSHD